MRLFAGSILVGGLLFQAPTTVPKTTTAAEGIKKLTTDVDLLRTQLRYANQRIATLEKVNRESISLDASHPGTYEDVATTAGHFLLSLETVEPYLDGFKVTLDIGNTSAAEYNGFKLNVQWAGTLPDYDDPTFAKKADEWVKRTKTQTGDFPFLNALPPAAWTRVQLTLSPATPDDVKNIEIKMFVNSVSLRPPQAR
jgi:hypothetical protein